MILFGMDTNGILSIVESGLSRYYVKDEEEIPTCRDHHVTLCLQDIDLWNKFNTATNEMIVTKSGR